MSATVWSKFFWADWQVDPALRLSSFAARGLWMDMLCIAAAHEPIGYVSVAGRPLGATDIARMTGGSEDEVGALLGELDRNGVFSRDRHGRIYSRRMVADAKKAAISRKNGKTGGNPSLSKDSENPPWVNPPDNQGVKPQEPRANNHRPKETPSVLARRRATRLADDWEPTPEDVVYAVAKGLIDVPATSEKFRNYWTAKSGQGGTKLDWSATWRNWVMSEIERQPIRPPARRVDWC